MTTEKMDFKTEVKQLLDLMIHSLYSHKEISIRELISNASDAIDKTKYESLTNPDVIEHKGEWKIKISADKNAKTLTISDNGIGMTKDETVEALGTIAHSGTKEFLKSLRDKDIKDNPELIGQFGVGFYSSFMIADKVTVITRKAGSKDRTATKWESTADGSFTIEETEKNSSGTDVILHIKESEKSYLEEWQIREVIRKYSDYIEYPIVMDIEKQEDSALDKDKKVSVLKEEQLNSGKAIWLRDKAEITDAEHSEFYKHISHDFSEPLKTIHYKAEGTSEFVSLLYIPSHAPLDIFYKEFKIGPALYVKKVQIMDHCEQLIPPYLRFLKGIVDSSDLPLNVSREILQNNRQIGIIKNNITKKVIDLLSEMNKNEHEKYVKFHNEFSKILKEGLHFDYSRKEAIVDLLLFRTTKTEGDNFRTISEYIADMKEGQEEVYYITGTSLSEVSASPHLEMFKEKEYEVIFMTDEIDDILFNRLDYKGKKFKSVIKGEIKLDSSEDINKSEKAYKKLVELIKEKLKSDVSDVRISGRLKDSPCCLVSDADAIDPGMERILKAMGQEVPERKFILEINPKHPLCKMMKQIHDNGGETEMLDEHISALYDQALLLSGSRPKNPILFTKYISKLMLEQTKNA